MIIVSQSKEIIIEDINLSINTAGEEYLRYKIYNIKINTALGYYETKERAKEVLREIIRAINSGSKIYEMPEE